MQLPFHDGLHPTKRCDQECREMADRHYSRQKVGAREFMGPGRTLVLRSASGDILFGWLWPLDGMRMDGQTGYNCTIFRNESRRQSSLVIHEAEQLAVDRWGPNRFYTYVDPGKIRSTNPGYCFQCAGWQKIGRSKSGLILFAKEPVAG